MNHTESVIRAIKDRIAAAMGELEEAAPASNKKENHRRLSDAAIELHKCADEMQNVLMRIRPK
ncbi:MAG: hypothetical protein ABFD49_08545 [Armatimonadota bacterium]|nr:hypothetical protein [bacterium]